MDPRLPGEKWDFEHILSSIAEIDSQLKNEDKANGHEPQARKYRIVGHRNKEVVTATDMGIKADKNDHTGAHIPYFSVHVLLHGEIQRVVDSVDSKFETTTRLFEIGQHCYLWKELEYEGMDIKMLVSGWRDSTRAVAIMSEDDKAFYSSAGIWLPKKFDASVVNPFRSVMLEFEEAQGDNAIFISDDYFFAARKALLKEEVASRLHRDPDFCSQWEDDKIRFREQKRIVWGELFLAQNIEEWSENMLKMIDKLLHLQVLQDDLDDVDVPEEEIRASLVHASQLAFNKCHPKIMQELEDYEELREMVENTKHFKIYPNNEALHYSFLHRDNRQINEILGKAEAVLPRAVLPEQVPPVRNQVK